MSLDRIFKEKSSDKKFLLQLFQVARKNYPDIITYMDALTLRLERDDVFHAKFVHEIETTFKDLRFVKFLTTSGLLQNNSVFHLFFNRIGNIILPEIEDDHTLTSIVNELFYNHANFKNFKLIPKDRWERFYKALFRNYSDQEIHGITKAIKSQLIESITILADKISGGISDNEMVRYRPEDEYFSTPFHKFSIDIRNLIENPEAPFDLLEIRQAIKHCTTYLNDILLQKDEKGISLKITVKIKRLLQELQRVQELIKVYKDLSPEKLIMFFTNTTKAWAEYYSPRNWISNQISSTVYLITFLATYHNGKTGEKYITTTTKEYIKMFMTASGGGLIVAILCYIKSWTGYIDDISPFSKAFLFGLNYAIGFVAIYLLHLTLATKQPAMTASLIAHTLTKDNDDQKINFNEFSKLFARVSRSQFIAFIGNVVSCFALATILFWIFKHLLGWRVVTTSSALHYWDELAYMDPNIFWFASIAGFFLFISGLVSGLVINYQRYNNVPNRIYNHPILRRFFKPKTRTKIANWFSKNNGGVIGNIVFGFMMGFAFLVGDFLKIPFDIRHITFAAGNLAMGLGGIGYGGITIQTIITAIISIFLIGGFNFIVSFLLSLILAMRSNNIRLYYIFPMLFAVIKEFFKNPYKFFFPPIVRFKK